MKKTYCVSLNGELFDSEDFNSRKEAIDYMNKYLENGTLFWVGVSVPITLKDVKKCCHMDGEDINIAMSDLVGEACEEWLTHIKEKEWEELCEIIAKWIWKKEKPTFFRVLEIEQYKAK